MLALIVFIIICFAAAGLGSVFTNSSLKTWYPTIKKPSFNPPNQIFAPVWSTLFMMMAVAGWLVWTRTSANGLSSAIVLFGIQLLLNIGWSAVFFGLRSPGGALVEIVFLWVFIVLTLLSFWSVSSLAALLLLPYLLWVSFAAYLNFSIWRLNP